MDSYHIRRISKTSIKNGKWQTKTPIILIVMEHYLAISTFIAQWQKENIIIDVFELNTKFAKDFKKFLSDSNIPIEIQNEFTKDLN